VSIGDVYPVGEVPAIAALHGAEPVDGVQSAIITVSTASDGTGEAVMRPA